MEVLRLLEYSQYLRHRYWETLMQLPWAEVVKDRGASHSSLRDIHLHCVNMLDFWVNHFLQGDPTYLRVNYDDYDSVEKISEYSEQVESKANAYLSKVTPEVLSRKIERTHRDGTTIMVTVEDILIDLFQEETHHRGELIALLWQMDVDPHHLWLTQYLYLCKKSSEFTFVKELFLEVFHSQRTRK